MKIQTELDELPRFKNYKILQVSTHGHDKPIHPLAIRKGQAEPVIMHRDQLPILVNDKIVFPEMRGPGKIVNIWFTFTPAVRYPAGKDPQEIPKKYLLRFLPMVFKIIQHKHKPIAHRLVRIRIYFDNEKEPSVDSPIGDFFGVGFGEYKHYISRYLAITAGGYVCQFHMPFKKSARVEIVNTSKQYAIPAFYGAITYAKYESEDDIKNEGYFHAKYYQEHPTKEGEPFLILDTTLPHFGGRNKARGHFAGLVLSCQPLKPRKHQFSYLEGNTKMYIDGEIDPSIEYTGTEDIFQGAWYYIKSIHRKKTEFCAPYHGLTVRSLNKRGAALAFVLAKLSKAKSSQYRFYPEGIPFDERIRVILHHGEFDEVPAHYDCVAYWYQEH